MIQIHITLDILIGRDLAHTKEISIYGKGQEGNIIPGCLVSVLAFNLAFRSLFFIYFLNNLTSKL